MLPSEIAALKRQRAREAKERAVREKEEAFRAFIRRKESRRQRQDRLRADYFRDDPSEPESDTTPASGSDVGSAASPSKKADTLGQPAVTQTRLRTEKAFDSIDALCKFTQDRVRSAGSALDEFRKNAADSDDEGLDSDDEQSESGHKSPVRSAVQRQVRWMAVVSSVQDKFGIPPARQISMGAVYKQEDQRMEAPFIASVESKYPTPKPVIDQFHKTRSNLKAFQTRLVGLHQQPEPSRPQDLLRLDNEHNAKLHLDTLEADLRQYKKIQAKELYLQRKRRVLSAGMAQYSHDPGEYSRFSMDITYSKSDLRSKFVEGSPRKRRDTLGYENLPSRRGEPLSRFQAAAENFVRTSLVSGSFNEASTDAVNDTTSPNTSAEGNVLITEEDEHGVSDDNSTTSPVKTAIASPEPSTTRHVPQVDDRETAAVEQVPSKTSWTCKFCKLSNSGDPVCEQFCPNCGSDNPLWVDPNPPLRLEDATIEIPYKYRGLDSVVCYCPEDADALTEGQLKFTLEEVVGLEAPATKLEMTNVLKTVIKNSLIKLGYWDENGPVRQIAFTGQLPFEIDAVAGIAITSLGQIFTMKLRWVKRALDKIGENSEGLSRKKLQQQLINGIRRHQGARSIQKVFRGFSHRKVFRVHLDWWRARSDHPFFVAKRAAINILNPAKYSETGATIFDVQVAPILKSSQMVTDESREWHKLRQKFWSDGRKLSFRGRPHQRLAHGAAADAVGASHSKYPGQTGTRIKQLLSTGGGYIDSPDSTSQQVRPRVREATNTELVPFILFACHFVVREKTRMPSKDDMIMLALLSPSTQRVDFLEWGMGFPIPMPLLILGITMQPKFNEYSGATAAATGGINSPAFTLSTAETRPVWKRFFKLAFLLGQVVQESPLRMQTAPYITKQCKVLLSRGEVWHTWCAGKLLMQMATTITDTLCS